MAESSVYHGKRNQARSTENQQKINLGEINMISKRCGTKMICKGCELDWQGNVFPGRSTKNVMTTRGFLACFGPFGIGLRGWGVLFTRGRALPSGMGLEGCDEKGKRVKSGEKLNSSFYPMGK